MRLEAVAAQLSAHPPAGFVLLDFQGPLATAIDAEMLAELGSGIYGDRCCAVVGVATRVQWEAATQAAAARASRIWSSGGRGLGSGGTCREAVERARGRLAQRMHPDRGGSHEEMAKLNRAREAGLAAADARFPTS